MGGDCNTTFTSFPSAEDESSTLENDYPKFHRNSPISDRDEDESDSGFNGFVSEDFDEVGHQVKTTPLESDGDLRRKTTYNEIMKNYDELWAPSSSLDQAKTKILRYTPGSWISNVSGKKLGNYVIPKVTTILLVGPKGSGKSSLVNRISKVFEDDKFASERAQVTYNSSSGEGTFFLEEYVIPRGASSFCLFDTRSLSENFDENKEMLQHWMTKGVRHGEPIIRCSDSSSLKMTLKCKAQQSGSPSSEIRKVNFVIFVVNGFSVLRCMNSDKKEDKSYMEMVTKIFNYPYLSFKDDKPVVAVTHGDFLSLRDRARVRIYLGEKLGVPPAKQIFDVPENSDQATELAIVAMIRYSLEHADKNLACRETGALVDRTVLSNNNFMYKLCSISSLMLMFLAILFAIASAVMPMHPSWNYNHRVSTYIEDWHSKSVEHPHHNLLMRYASRLQSKSGVDHSQEQQIHEREEPKMEFPPASTSKFVTSKSVPRLFSMPKPAKDGPCKHCRSRAGHPKSKLKWHKIRHLWLDDDSESAVKWHKIRHLWADYSDNRPKSAEKSHKIRHLCADDDSERRHPKSAVKWHKIRHLWADDD